MQKVLYLTTIILFIATTVYARELYHPYNMDFEEGSLRGVPSGWFLPTFSENAGYKAQISSENPLSGKYCLKLHFDSIPPAGTYGSVMQSINAEQYRGKKIRLRAAIRTELIGDSSSAHLWLRTHLLSKQTGFFDLMEDRPITTNSKWQYYEISGIINEDAYTINFGLLLKGGGKAWIDAAELEILREDSILFEKPRQLSNRGLQNIATFAKTLRLIRYFYPGTEALKTDWERFALAGVEFFENVNNNEELFEKLNQVFKPIAPSIDFRLDYGSNNDNSNKIKTITTEKSAIPANALKNVALVLKHIGLSPAEDESHIYKAVPFNIYQSSRMQDGIAAQYVNAEQLRGKTVRFTAFIKTELHSLSGQAQLIAAIEFDNTDNRKSQKKPIIHQLPDHSVKNTKWEKHSLDFKVPKDAEKIRLGLVLIGEGKAYFDETSLKIIEDEKEGPKNFISNPSFEQETKSKLVYGWRFLNEEKNREYYGSVINKGAYFGKQCLEIKSDEESMVRFPKPGETVNIDLGNNIAITLPLTLFVDSIQTLPYAKSALPKDFYKRPMDFVLTADDRSSRVAMSMLLWGIVSTFSVFNDTDEEWNTALEKSLVSSAVNKNIAEYTVTLEKLIAPLNDCQARIWSDRSKIEAAYPLNIRLFNGKYLISQTVPEFKALIPGDEITAVNQMPIKNVMNALKSRFSGSDDRWRTLRAIAQLRSGELGSLDTLSINQIDGESVEMPVERSIYFTELPEIRPDAFYKFEDMDIYYIDLTRFDDVEMKDTAKYLRFADKIIFDLRGNTSVSEHFLGMFSDEAMQNVKWEIPIRTTPEKNVYSSKFVQSTISSLPLQLTRNIVFLCDERTMGYSEGILAIVKNYNLGKIIGRKSAGSPGEFSAMRLPGSFYITLTAMYGISPKGEYLHKTGIIPDIVVESSLESMIENKDEILLKAIDFLNGSQNSR